ncbi:hypothetical protein Droror1_Dr00002358 [Drosera rotundifolia]
MTMRSGKGLSSDGGKADMLKDVKDGVRWVDRVHEKGVSYADALCGKAKCQNQFGVVDDEVRLGAGNYCGIRLVD